MADNDLSVDVDLDTSGVNREAEAAAATIAKMLANVKALAESLTGAVGAAKQLGDNFAYTATKAEKSNAEIAALKKQIADMRALSGGEAISRQKILGGASPNGGTYRDDQLKSFALRAQITALGTTDTQIEAQLKEAAVKMVLRQKKVTDDAIKATLNAATYNQQQLISNYNDPAALQARTVKADAARIRDTQRYAPYASGSAYVSAQQEEAFKKAQQDRLDATYAEIRQSSRLMRASELAQQRQTAAEERALGQRLTEIGKSSRLRFNSEAKIAKAEEQRVDAIYAEIRQRTRLMAASEAMQKRQEAAAAREAARNAPKAERGFGERIGARAQLATDYIAIGAVYGGATAAVRGIKDLDDELTRFAAITQTSNAEMGTFKDGLLALSETSRFSVKDLTDVATTLGQTGLSAQEVVKTLPSVTTLATAAGSSLREAVDLITSVMGAYQMQASSSADIANTLTEALNQTKLTTTQLAQGLSYSSNIAKEAGVSFSELTAVIGGLAQAGIRSGSTLGTGTRQLIQDLTAPSEKLLAAMKPLGLTLTDINVRANGLIGVLENLRAKGFTTADALKSLDLRAASAYAALASQTDKLKLLEQSFLLSNAASEGADVASKSLTAGLTRLGNVILSILDKAFTPFVEVLKGLVDGLASVLGGISSLGAVLGAGTSVLIAYGAALAGIRLVSFVSQIPAAITGLTAMTTALTSSAGSMTAISAASVAFGPVGTIIATAAALAAGGLVYLSTRADALTQKLDKVRETSNLLQSDQQKTEASISSINATIDGLLDRREKLNNDPLGRQTEIIKAQKAFADLGLTVKSGSTSIDELVAALQKLRGELSQELPATLEKRIEAAQKKIDLTLEQGKASTARNRAADPALRGYSNRFFGGSLNAGLDFLQQDVRTIDTSQASTIAAPMFANLRELRRKSAGNADLLRVLDDFDALLVERVKFLNGIQAEKMKKLALEADQKVTDIRNLPQTQELMQLRDSVYGELKQGMQRIESMSLASPGQKRDAFIDLSDDLKGKVGNVTGLFERFRADLKDKGFDEAAIDGALKQLEDELVAVSKGVETSEKDATEAYAKLNKIVNAGRKRNIAAQLTEARNRLRNAQTPMETEYAFRRIDDLIDLEHQIEKDIITNGIKDPARLTDEQKALLEQEQERTDALKRKQEEDRAERFKQDTIAGLALESTALGASKDTIEKQIAQLKKQIADPSTTVERAKEIEKQINLLLEQVADIVKRQINVDTNRELLQTRGGPQALAAGAPEIARQIFDALTSAGRTDRLGTALSFAQQESTFNPNANRDNTKAAKGLFQFIPSTFAANGGGDLYNVQDQVKNFISYIDKIDAVLGKALGRMPTDFERYVGWQQGEGGGKDLLTSSPSARVRDVVAAQNVRSNGGDPNGTVAEFLAVIRAQFERAQQATAGLTVTTEGLIKAKAEEAKKAADVTAQTGKEAAAKDVAVKAYRAEAVAAGLKQKGDEQTIKSKSAGIANTDSSVAAEKLTLEIVGLLAGELKRELALIEADPKYRNDPTAKADAITATRDKFAERFNQLAPKNAANAADQDTAVLKRKLDILETDRKTREEAGLGTAEIEKQIYALQQRLSLSQPLVEKERELSILTAQINAAKENGLGTDQTLNDAVERQAVLQREILALKEKQVIATRNLAAEPSYADAFAKGSQNFFKNAGMLNADGEFKSFTQEISGYWTEALGGMQSGMSSLFKNLASGTMKAGDAFKQFAQSVIGNMLDIASKAVSNEILKMLFGGGGGGGGLGSIFGSIFGGGGGAAASTAGAFDPLGGLFALGGVVRAAGGYAVPTRDSQLILAQPGEGILRKSAMDLIGRETFDNMNNMGNRTVSKNLNGAKMPPPKKPDLVNVWVVSPENVPPPGPKDIIHAVSSDIQNRGNLRQLIKQVQVGQI